VIFVGQSGNQFTQPMVIAFGETHRMTSRRRSSSYFFRISNGRRLREALERMAADWDFIVDDLDKGF